MYKLSDDDFLSLVRQYVHHVLKSVDFSEGVSHDTRMFNAGVADGINSVFIDCFTGDYPQFRERTEEIMNQYNYSRYGTSLDILKGVAR